MTAASLTPLSFFTPGFLTRVNITIACPENIIGVFPAHLLNACALVQSGQKLMGQRNWCFVEELPDAQPMPRAQSLNKASAAAATADGDPPPTGGPAGDRSHLLPRWLKHPSSFYDRRALSPSHSISPRNNQCAPPCFDACSWLSMWGILFAAPVLKSNGHSQAAAPASNLLNFLFRGV